MMARSPHSALTAICKLDRVLNPRASTRASRWLLTLWLLVFSAHHAAPNAPIWRAAAWHEGTRAHHRVVHEPECVKLVQPHEHLHSHCELCFSSSFNVPLPLSAPLRPTLGAITDQYELFGTRALTDLPPIV
jgi:hypothetical protein